MDFLDSLKDIKKSLEKEQNKPAKTKNQSSKSGSSLKNDLASLQELKNQIPQDNEKQELEELFLKEEKLRDEFEEFIKNSDIKRMK